MTVARTNGFVVRRLCVQQHNSVTTASLSKKKCLVASIRSITTTITDGRIWRIGVKFGMMGTNNNTIN